MKNLIERLKNISVKWWLTLGIVFLLGIIAAFGIRFIFVDKPEATHYHANFAVYVNDKREEFKEFTFYEEIQACSPKNSDNPRSRVHMHSQKNSEVHVHDQAATWGHFFANLDYGLTNDLLETQDGVYQDGVDGKKLTFILNGKKVDDIYNRTIGNEDTLLINYGSNDEKIINERFAQIAKTAEALNETQDPAACAGSQSESLMDRFKRTLGIEESHSH